MKKSAFKMNRNYIKIINLLGLDYNKVLELAGLPNDLFNNNYVNVSLNEYIRFLNALEELTNDNLLPLKIGTIEGFEIIEPSIFAAYSSKNFLTAIKRLTYYKSLIGPIKFHISETYNKVTLEIIFEYKSHELPEFIVLMEIVMLINLVRLATKELVIPENIITKFIVQNEEYTKFFGVRPKLGNKNKIIFKKEDCLKPFLSNNDSIWNCIKPELNRQLKEINGDIKWSYRVKETLIELLPEGKQDLEEVAKSLGTSKRSLQRRLREEGTTFRKELNYTREELAKSYFRRTNFSSEDISYLLGYREIQSFIRAFNSWTNNTITNYKKDLINNI